VECTTLCIKAVKVAGMDTLPYFSKDSGKVAMGERALLKDL